MPKNKDTMAYFKRYSKFYLKTEDDKTCWRVEATDFISMPGVLEINAVEYYANEQEDDLENGVVGALITKPIDPNPTEEENSIIGQTFIYPKKTYTYTFDGSLVTNWVVDSKLPIKYVVDKDADNPTIKITWISGYSGQFDLLYGDYKKTIVVQSLF
ncbi:MAG: hypothetical protein PUJ51_08570 [Clostridiales bacterium]|nr:hypothetical protein [Clostridiales bacterium]